MITIGKHRVRSYMNMEFSFSGIRVVEEELMPVQWQINAILIPTQKKRITPEIAARNTEIAYQRLYFWLETNMPNVIAVSSDDNIGLSIGSTASNIMMICPGTPYDELIAELLHSKFTALVAGNMIVGEVTIKSSDSTATFTYDCPDGEYMLPLTVAEYIPVNSKYKLPWWSRNDGFCFEFLKLSSAAEQTDDEYFGDIIDPMTEFESAMGELFDDNDEALLAPIIQVEKWKPKKI